MDNRPWALLGGMRFFLACIVVVNHLHWFIASPLDELRAFGAFTAVLAFLFISGYSIAASLERSLTGFYRRRLRRIYPVYVLAVILSLIPFLIVGRDSFVLTDVTLPRPTPMDFLGNIFMLQGFLIGPLGSNPAIWSLSFECACYVLAPLFLRLRTAVLLPMALLSLSFFTISRGPLGLPYYPFMPYGLGFLALLWAWLIGFLFYRHRFDKTAHAAMIILAPLVPALNRTDEARLSAVTLTITALALIAGSDLPISSRFERILTRLGDISYPLYLLHIPIMLLVMVILQHLI